MISTEQLQAKREQLMADFLAIQGAIQLIDSLIAESEQPEAMTMDELKNAIGAQSVEVTKL